MSDSPIDGARVSEIRGVSDRIGATNEKRPGSAGNTVNPGLTPAKEGLMPDSTQKPRQRDSLDDCPCPYCDVPPRIGDLLPGVLAEMRRREGER